MTASAPKQFYFVSGGRVRFSMDANEEGRFPIEQAVGLLALHCMAGKASPHEYSVMTNDDCPEMSVIADRVSAEIGKARQLVPSGMLTRRETEVLDGVCGWLSNKEIAVNLNLSERTVKFHVSSLLVKFSVSGRRELAIAAMLKNFSEVNSKEGR